MSEVIRVVRADLSYLRDNWTGDADEDTLRRDSAVLRRLLIQQMLMRARSALRLKGEPRIAYLDLRDSLRAGDKSTVVYGSAGGMFFRGLVIGPAELSPSDELGPSRPGALTPVARPLSKYLTDPGLCVAGVMIQRREIIKYVANKLGSAHYDTRRLRKVEQAIQVARNSIVVLETDPAYLELLAIGQALASSQEVMEPFGLESAPSPVQ